MGKLDNIIKQIEEEMKADEHRLVYGLIANFEEYKRATGRLEAIRKMIDIVREEKKKDDDDADTGPRVRG